MSQQAGSLLYAQQAEQAGGNPGAAGPGAGTAGGAGAPGGSAGGDDVVDAEIIDEDNKK